MKSVCSHNNSISTKYDDDELQEVLNQMQQIRKFQG